MSSLLHDVYFHSQLDSQIHITTVLRPQFAGSGEPAIKQITLYYWLHNDIAIYRFTIIHFILFYFFLCSTAYFTLTLKSLNKCANLTRHIDPPSKPAKMSCRGDTPNPHANMTRPIHEPKIPPSLLKIPGRTQLASLPPPSPPPGSVNGAGGGGGEPTRPAYASCTGTFAFPFMFTYSHRT